MYVYIVEFLGVRLAFKTEQAAEEYIVMTFGDDTSASVHPCVMVGE